MTDSLTTMKGLIATVAGGAALTEGEAETAFDIIMSGDATPAQIGALLMGLRVRGETVDEITGAVRVMRAKALAVSAPANAIDIVGTGGDASGTFNISTAASLLVAACGVPVAKHGNRALSSKSGAADVLTALGVNIEADIAVVEQAIREAGIGFMMAPRHHSAMRHVAGPRVELGTRTVFNLLGPLSNPAGVRRQFSGAFAREWIEPMARVLGNLGSERAWVVHGSDGLDELTTTGPTYVAELKDGAVTTFEVGPDDARLPTAKPEDLKGGDAETNAAAITGLLAGEAGPFRDVVLMNAAAALIVANRAASLAEGAAMAAMAIDDGSARATLAKLVAITTAQSPSLRSADKGMSDVLARICAKKRIHVDERRCEWPHAEVVRAARSAPPPRGFARALEAAVGGGGYGLIAEIKRASPSKGLIRADFDPDSLAWAYAAGGATCLSVLTDIPFFQGDDAYLTAARAAVGLPVLRKDFMLEPYQIAEARVLGADCVLLIMAALEDGDAAVLASEAAELGMDVLVEVHDASELERALKLDARLIGINNRNLKTLEVDLATTEALAPQVPADRLLVCESGLTSPDDLARMAAVGARCFLIGESLMRQPDVEAATRAVLSRPAESLGAAD